MPPFANLRQLSRWSPDDNTYASSRMPLPYMKNLVHLSLKYDCNSYFLHTLTETCKDTLRILDIEFSKQVQDDSVNYIKDFQNLLKINMFRTGLSTQGQVSLKILKNYDEPFVEKWSLQIRHFFRISSNFHKLSMRQWL